jgi:hypothetical protein
MLVLSACCLSSNEAQNGWVSLEKGKQKTNQERKWHRENTVNDETNEPIHWQFSYNVAGIDGKIRGPLCKKTSFYGRSTDT